MHQPVELYYLKLTSLPRRHLRLNYYLFISLVENLAFKKETWLNKERHRKRALNGHEVDVILSQKLAEKAVDGVITNDINNCAILDNYYDDEPQLTIDLGARRDVSGVTVYTWQGQQDGK